MSPGAIILWFLMATTGPRMDEDGPIAHPRSLAHFHTKTECEKKALKIVKENMLPGQVTTYSCVKGSDQGPDAPESMATMKPKCIRYPFLFRRSMLF
jgi:hypothetical protein